MAEKIVESIVILGNQLVPNHPAVRKHPKARIIMIEADDICRKHRYHKHKLILVLAGMREYADNLRKNGRHVTYINYEPGSSLRRSLIKDLTGSGTNSLIWMHASDRCPNRVLADVAKQLGCQSITYTNKQFLTTTKQFGGWLEDQTAKTPLMETFYRWQRKRLDILMVGNKPQGGSWNYDHENRKPIPKKTPDIPRLPSLRRSKHVNEVAELVDEHFADNPGASDSFWLPTTRAGAKAWLDSFISERLKDFGRYEDAMKSDEPFLYHSVLSPLLNVGLLTPDECTAAALEAYESNKAPLNSVEGFVRQIIGWREFMYGLYWWRYDEFSGNFFGFDKQLEDWWYSNENVPDEVPEPVKICLDRVHRYGYGHHIERLMVLGNWFLLSGYDPKSVYEWFSAMYVDAYEWVMIPNVLGMSQYADGGMLATKPYVSGGNYLQKMGSWWETQQEAKDSDFTIKYWQFIYDNRAKFANNHRMSLVVSQAEKHVTS